MLAQADHHQTLGQDANDQNASHHTACLAGTAADGYAAKHRGTDHIVAQVGTAVWGTGEGPDIIMMPAIPVRRPHSALAIILT